MSQETLATSQKASPAAKQAIHQSSPQYWDSMVTDFDAIYSGETRTKIGVMLDKWLRRDIFDRVTETVNIVNKLGKNQRVIDVGCGTGRLGVPLAKAGHYVLGVDFSEEMLEKARAITRQAGVADKCEFMQGDMVDSTPAALRGQYFDAAVALGVFDYISDALPMLKQMASFQPKKIIVSLPREGTLRSYIRRLRYKVQGLDCPLYFYTPKQISGFGKALGAKHTSHYIMGELHFTVFDM